MVLSATFYVSPLFLGFGLIGLAVTIFCIVDIARRPEYAWQASGQSKVLWLVLVIIGHFFCWLIMDLIYLLAIRPKVVAAGQGGGPGGGYGSPYGGAPYGTPPAYGGPAPYGTPPPPAPYGGAAPYGTPPPYGGSGGTDAGYGAPTGTDAGYGTGGAPPPPSNSPPPGWYPDPAGSGQPRYWNGSAWS